MSDAQPIVTVIIASYNHGRYIEESILSVLNQTYSNIELLVVEMSRGPIPAVSKPRKVLPPL